MSIKLDDKALENIRTYKYKTHGLTFIERWFLDPFWNFTCERLPRVSPPQCLTPFHSRLLLT